MQKRVLILCSANSIRSQMAEGLWRDIACGAWEVYSAGVFGSGHVHPMASRVMQEIGIDLSEQCSKSVESFRNQRFDLLVTVCDNAREGCPSFVQAAQHVHWPMDDPTVFGASESARLAAFRRVRDELKLAIEQFLKSGKLE